MCTQLHKSTQFSYLPYNVSAVCFGKSMALFFDYQIRDYCNKSSVSKDLNNCINDCYSYRDS